jgi:hypothetical protein
MRYVQKGDRFIIKPVRDEYGPVTFERTVKGPYKVVDFTDDYVIYRDEGILKAVSRLSIERYLG